MAPAGEMYTRQVELERIIGRPLNIPKCAAVVGCGGTGSWVAMFLAMSGCPEIHLFDADKIEESNLNRLPFARDMIGEYKTHAVNRFIKKIREGVEVATFTDKIEEGNIFCLSGYDVVYCCTDNIASQQLINRYCRDNNITYQRCGYDGLTLNVSRSYPMTFKKAAEQRAGYEITPSWVIPAATSACLAVYSTFVHELPFTEDMRNIVMANSGVVQQSIIEKIGANIKSEMYETIRQELLDDDYGYCPDCERGDCNDCSRGDCDGCERVDPDNIPEWISEGNYDRQIIDRIQDNDYDDTINAMIKDADFDEACIKRVLEMDDFEDMIDINEENAKKAKELIKALKEHFEGSDHEI